MGSDSTVQATSRAGRRCGKTTPAHPSAGSQQPPGLHGMARAIGNASFARLVQARLSVSHPTDAYEQEADRVADAIMRMDEPALAHGAPPAIARVCADCEEELDRERSAQSEARAAESSTTVSADLETAIAALPGGGRPLPEEVRAFVEPRFGHDFSAVRVHADAGAAELARSVQARAFTVGEDIVFGAGEYAPDTTAGMRLLAHELTHVVQQGGSVERTPKPLARQDSGAAGVTPAASMRTVKVWVHSFIPMPMVSDPLGHCFSGDNRGFSNMIHASYRTHQEVELDVTTSAKSIDWSDTGTTHLLDCTTGAVTSSAKASTSGLVNGPVVSASGGRYSINFTGTAKNPLAWYACAIDLNLDVTIDPASRTCTVQGQHDGFPAYEVYVTADGGAGVSVYTYDPRVAGEGPTALCGGLDKTASGSATF